MKKDAQASLASFFLLICGETEIRTPDTLLAYTRFPGVPLKPLEHLSIYNLPCTMYHFHLYIYSFTSKHTALLRQQIVHGT